MKPLLMHGETEGLVLIFWTTFWIALADFHGKAVKKYFQFLNIDSNKGDPGGFGRRAKPVLEKQLFAGMSDAHSSSQQVSQGSQMRCALRRGSLADEKKILSSRKGCSGIHRDWHHDVEVVFTKVEFSWACALIEL